MFKVGDKVEIVRVSDYSGTKYGEKYTIISDDGTKEYQFTLKNKEKVCELVGDSEIKLVSKSKKNMKQTKPEFKVGDEVMNESNDQKSKVLAIYFDKEDECNKYVLQCMDDSGSIHLESEDDVSEIEYVKVTVAELIADYEENNGVKVKIAK